MQTPGGRRARLRLRAILVLVMLAWAGLQPATTAGADDAADPMQELQTKSSQIDAELANAKGALAQVYWQKEQVLNKLQVAESELNLARSKYAVLDEQRKAAQAEKDRLDAAVKATETRLSGRKATMGARLRAIQQRGRVSYLGVLLGSQDYGDFIGRMDMLGSIVKLDSSLMGEMRVDLKTLGDQRSLAVAEEARLKDVQAQVQVQADEAAAKQAEYKRLNDDLLVKQQQVQARVAEWEQKSAAVEQEIWQLQLAQNRKAGKFAPIEPLRGKPEITDPFGWRTHPIWGDRRFHTGTDFGAAMGTPIYAIEDGVVIYEGWDDAYGNRIVIDHGGGISSWYGHMSAFVVKQGATVKQGDQIGRVGSTGLSTGPHLHLEIRINNEPQDAMAYYHR